MLDFPGPGGLTVGQVFTSAGKSWQWDGAKWAAAAGGGAPLDSPSFTGDPKAPTPATADNDTSIATTAYVKAQGYLLNNQVITLSGDIAGSGATAIAATLATVNSNVGTFAIQTVNAKGLVTAAANMTGDVTTSGGAATLATVNSNVGTFQGLTLDAKGRVTAAANQNYVTGGPYLPTAGGTVSGALTVSSSITTAGPIYLGGNIIFFAGATSAGPYVSGDNANIQWRLGPSNGYYAWYDSTNSVLAMYLGPAGDLLVNSSNAQKPGGGPWNAPSDMRLKTTIEPYQAGLAELQQLQPITYEYNGEAGMPTGERFCGLVADDVELVMPETVGKTRLGINPATSDPGQEYLTFNQGPLTFALINSTKEIADLINKLTERVAALEAGR